MNIGSSSRRDSARIPEDDGLVTVNVTTANMKVGYNTLQRRVALSAKATKPDDLIGGSATEQDMYIRPGDVLFQTTLEATGSEGTRFSTGAVHASLNGIPVSGFSTAEEFAAGFRVVGFSKTSYVSSGEQKNASSFIAAAISGLHGGYNVSNHHLYPGDQIVADFGSLWDNNTRATVLSSLNMGGGKIVPPLKVLQYDTFDALKEMAYSLLLNNKQLPVPLLLQNNPAGMNSDALDGALRMKQALLSIVFQGVVRLRQAGVVEIAAPNRPLDSNNYSEFDFSSTRTVKDLNENPATFTFNNGTLRPGITQGVSVPAYTQQLQWLAYKLGLLPTTTSESSGREENTVLTTALLGTIVNGLISDASVRYSFDIANAFPTTMQSKFRASDGTYKLDKTKVVGVLSSQQQDGLTHLLSLASRNICSNINRYVGTCTNFVPVGGKVKFVR